LTSLLARNPRHLGAREALVIALADAGDLERGRAALDSWPAELRDARYARLLGRWDLEYGHEPARAVEALKRASADLPHDWRTHYRLARALNSIGSTAEAHREAETVSRLREVLDPDNLGHRLEKDFAHLDEAKSRLDLASLCDTVGLYRLAEAWRAESSESTDLRNGLRGVGFEESSHKPLSSEAHQTH